MGEKIDFLEQQKAFKHMLKASKFFEINIKILHHILVTPVTGVRHTPNLQWCSWCGAKAGVDHLFLEC